MEQILDRFDLRVWLLRPHFELCLSKTPAYWGSAVQMGVNLVIQTTFVQAIKITAIAQISHYLRRFHFPKHFSVLQLRSFSVILHFTEI